MENGEKIEQRDSRLRAILRLAGLTALVTVGLVIVVAGICWFAGWRSAAQISSGLSLAGGIVIAIGVLSTVGGWGLTRDAQYMYSQSVSHQSTSERTGQALRDSLRSCNLAIVATAAGLLCIAVAALI
jgi:hypothetical protein